MTTPSIVRSLSGRAIHLRIYPRPTSISQSREIIHYLSQYGEIEYYRNLKYDRDPAPSPTSALLIYRTPESATECLRHDPIRFSLGRTKAKTDPEDDSEYEIIRGTDPLSPERKIHIPGLSPFSKEDSYEENHTSGEEGQMFQISVRQARANFRDQINQSHFHGGFEVNTKSAAQQDLVRKVPLKGLSDLDWSVDKPWRTIGWELERDRKGKTRRKPLREVWEEGAKAAEEA